ncbi:MAG TPA: transcriptional repressor [Syntrophales bacterium]|nr:transcriptional repressor [Syntrophales bacterium]
MKDKIIKKLKGKGLKLTSQRLAVIEAFTENYLLHPSADTIYKEAKKKKAGISLSTVYYTLNEFARNGIISVLEFDKMDNRHEGNTDTHIHLICKHCKDIIDVFPKSFRPQKIIKGVDFVVTDTRFEYYGYCAKCRGKRDHSKKH